MQYVVTIDMENGAFDENEAGEIARILRDLADKVEASRRIDMRRGLRDKNDNIVGEALLKD